MIRSARGVHVPLQSASDYAGQGAIPLASDPCHCWLDAMNALGSVLAGCE